MLGCKHELEAPFAGVEIRSRFARGVDGVIVKNHEDHAIFRVSRIDQLQKVDEIRTLVSLANQAVHFAGDQIYAGKKRQGSVPFVLVVATSKSVVGARPPVRVNVANRLNPGLLVIRNEYRPIRLRRTAQGVPEDEFHFDALV